MIEPRIRTQMRKEKKTMSAERASIDTWLFVVRGTCALGRQTKTIVVALTVALLLSFATAVPALASEQIESFTTTSSTSQAGGHPDLETSFSLASPGEPEAAQNVTFNSPQGIFGNTNAITRCIPADFALDQCPSNSQAGLITVRANYEGDPNELLGTAPIYNLVDRARRNGSLLLHRAGSGFADRASGHGANRDRLWASLYRVGHYSEHAALQREPDLLGSSRRYEP